MFNHNGRFPKGMVVLIGDSYFYPLHSGVIEFRNAPENDRPEARKEDVKVKTCLAIESRFVLVSSRFGGKVQPGVWAQFPKHIQLGPQFLRSGRLCLRSAYRQEK